MAATTRGDSTSKSKAAPKAKAKTYLCRFKAGHRPVLIAGYDGKTNPPPGGFIVRANTPQEAELMQQVASMLWGVGPRLKEVRRTCELTPETDRALESLQDAYYQATHGNLF